MLDLVGIPKDRFSDVAAHIYHDSLKCSSYSIINNTILSKYLFTKSKDKIPQNVSKKKRNYCLKSSLNARNRTVCLKCFGGACPWTPLGWLCAYGASNHTFGSQFLPHQPRIDGYVSVNCMGNYFLSHKMFHLLFL